MIKYWQPNFNNVKALRAHNDPIRDLSFSPNDSKFVTACDDATLKIFDFASSDEESTLTGHNWDAKSVDWHPTKGLIVSGSKDHQVKLWDPRTGRCLTTLHGHKNTISKTSFERTRGQLLATCARDQTARVFDLRMMRDICILRGHEKDISTLTWHPLHINLLTTGGSDGSIFHYLLDEPHAPEGAVTAIPPYDSPDPSSAPMETIFPAHRLSYAHDFAVWSLDWHPLGHILASGSNDRVTRFWARARPGETDCFNDRYHIGEAAAEAQGTWDRRGGRRVMQAEEEQEMEDEAEGLVDQKMPAKQAILPGLSGLPGLASRPSPTKANFDPRTAQPNLAGLAGLAGLGNFTANGLPPPPSTIASLDPSQLAAMMAEGKFPMPPPIGANGQGLPPPPPGFDFSKFPPGMFPPPFPLPQGMPQSMPQNMPPSVPQAVQQGYPPAGSVPGLPGLPSITSDAGSGSTSIRRRGPLPSQQESLMEEQRRGKYRTAR